MQNKPSSLRSAEAWICRNGLSSVTFVMLCNMTGADLTSKADEYRAKARECEDMAQGTRDPHIKQQMLVIAEKWRAMAPYEDKYAR
jgi:hypothetical protein